MRIPPLLADFIYNRGCELKCEKFLTRPRIGACTKAATTVSKPGESADTEVVRRGTPHQNAPPLRPWRLSGKHRAGVDRHDGRGSERLPLPRSTQRGSKSIFEKTSRGRGYGIIPLFTRAHLYTLSGVVRSAEGFVGAWEIHTPTLAACAAQGKLHFPCDSLRCLPFSALAESEHLASQAIHFPQV